VFDVITEFFTEFGFEAVGVINDIKSTVELVGSNPKFLWTLISLGVIYHKAVKINVREETLAEVRLDEEERAKLRKYTGEKMQTLKDSFWHLLDEYRDECEKKGINKVRVTSGNDELGDKPVSDVKRDYYSAVKDELGVPEEKPTMKERIVEKVMERHYQVKDEDSREKFIEELAKDERASTLSRIHKRSNYNKDLVQTEEKHLPFETVKDIINGIVTHAEMLEGVKGEKVSKLKSEFKVNPLSIVKIVGGVIIRAKERRWKRKQEKQQ